jgi:predicted small secreted protein
MVRTFIIAVTVAGSLAITGCNTVRGAAADVNSVANCTQNTINTGRCK